MHPCCQKGFCITIPSASATFLLSFMLSLDILIVVILNILIVIIVDILIVIILDSLIVVNATTGGEQPGNWAFIMWRGGELGGV